MMGLSASWRTMDRSSGDPSLGRSARVSTAGVAEDTLKIIGGRRPSGSDALIFWSPLATSVAALLRPFAVLELDGHGGDFVLADRRHQPDLLDGVELLLDGPGDLGLDVLRRRAGVHAHHGDLGSLGVGKEVHRHAAVAHEADDRRQQHQRADQVRPLQIGVDEAAWLTSRGVGDREDAHPGREPHEPRGSRHHHPVARTQIPFDDGLVEGAGGDRDRHGHEGCPRHRRPGPRRRRGHPPIPPAAASSGTSRPSPLSRWRSTPTVAPATKPEDGADRSTSKVARWLPCMAGKTRETSARTCSSPSVRSTGVPCRTLVSRAGGIAPRTRTELCRTMRSMGLSRYGQVAGVDHARGHDTVERGPGHRVAEAGLRLVSVAPGDLESRRCGGLRPPASAPTVPGRSRRSRTGRCRATWRRPGLRGRPARPPPRPRRRPTASSSSCASSRARTAPRATRSPSRTSTSLTSPDTRGAISASSAPQHLAQHVVHALQGPVRTAATCTAVAGSATSGRLVLFHDPLVPHGQKAGHDEHGTEDQ